MPQDDLPAAATQSAPSRKRRAARRQASPLPSELGPVIEAMADGVILSDRDGRVLQMNAALKHIIAADRYPEYFTFTPQQQHGVLQPRGMDGEPLPPDQWPTNHALAGHPIPPQDVLVRGMDKLDRILNITAMPIYNQEQVIIGVVTVYRDVTTQRRLEQMKDEFLSIAGHELRAPLTPILVAAQIAERRLQQPDRVGDALSLVRDVIRYTQRLNALMASVLDMTRIQADRLMLYPEPCDAATIIRDAVEAQTTQWRRPVAIQCPESGLLGEWDPTRLWQVIANLVSNALKYSPRESPVTVVAQVIADVHLHIDVMDAGPGIAPEEVPYLFERFYRGRYEQTREGHHEGLGLGLYITRAIVTAHGGSIVANSVVGMGTTFTVTLPLAPPPATQAQDPLS